MNTYNGYNVTKAIKTLSAYTNGRFSLFSLAGNARTSCRAHVMADLLGLPKIAQSKAGVVALRAAFYEALNIAGDCEAVRDNAFIATCRNIMANENKAA